MSFSSEIKLSHGDIQAAHAEINTIILKLQDLQKSIHSANGNVLSGWKGKSAEVFAQVDMENHAIFGSIVDELSDINKKMSETNQSFEDTDKSISEQVGR